MGKILTIINTAYRATLEEQDDTSLWFNHACRKAGAEIDILLTGNAVNYATRFQNPPPLDFGNSGVAHPNRFHEDLKAIQTTGAKVFLTTEDAEERGILPQYIIEGVEGISRSQLSKLLKDYHQVWYW